MKGLLFVALASASLVPPVPLRQLLLTTWTGTKVIPLPQVLASDGTVRDDQRVPRIR